MTAVDETERERLIEALRDLAKFQEEDDETNITAAEETYAWMAADLLRADAAEIAALRDANTALRRHGTVNTERELLDRMAEALRIAYYNRPLSNDAHAKITAALTKYDALPPATADAPAKVDIVSCAHAPLPWRYVPWHIEEGESAVRDANGILVCTTASDTCADFIARAANATQHPHPQTQPSAATAANTAEGEQGETWPVVWRELESLLDNPKWHDPQVSSWENYDVGQAIRIARFKLRALAKSFSPPASASISAEGEPRFFIDHGMIHDRVTGRHVTLEPDEEVLPMCGPDGTDTVLKRNDGISSTLALLNELSERARANTRAGVGKVRCEKCGGVGLDAKAEHACPDCLGFGFTAGDAKGAGPKDICGRPAELPADPDDYV